MVLVLVAMIDVLVALVWVLIALVRVLVAMVVMRAAVIVVLVRVGHRSLLPSSSRGSLTPCRAAHHSDLRRSARLGKRVARWRER